MKKSKINIKDKKNSTLTCQCGEIVHNCSEDAVKVTCWKCVCKLLNSNATFTNENINE